eukprot:TRINITY_DN254_c0_g1_i1.p1 TRINITY_DN254_c0_g1~~TRINITY_DN254_c0_g1_i1.p1  ORF type:complete len:188 (-),score=52.15 TRINITY_DN254_c0_g1_i1:168-683(-)
MTAKLSTSKTKNNNTSTSTSSSSTPSKHKSTSSASTSTNTNLKMSVFDKAPNPKFFTNSEDSSRRNSESLQKQTTEDFALIEIESAVHFWAQNMHATDLTNDQIRGFQLSLAKNLIAKFANHWEAEQPLKGHAFRSIQVAHGRVDSVLSSAAKQNNIHSFKSRIPSSICMW